LHALAISDVLGAKGNLDVVFTDLKVLNWELDFVSLEKVRVLT